MYAASMICHIPLPLACSADLTLLQESLGGNAKTSLVVAIANAVEHTEETLQSLQFGTRAMHVQTRAVVNESQGSKLLNADLLAKLANLELSPCLVDASLLAKEEELEKIQEALQASLLIWLEHSVSFSDLSVKTSLHRQSLARVTI